MKRIRILAGETIHIEGLPARVAEDALVDVNPNNLKLLEHVRWGEPKQATPPEVEATKGVHDAAHKFRDTLVPKADQLAHGVYPLWHGWALYDAFVAGAQWQSRSKPQQQPAIDAEAKYCPHGWDTRLECSKCFAASRSDKP